MLRILFTSLYVKYIFFRFYRSVRFEENFKYTKDRWNVLALQLSLSLRDKEHGLNSQGFFDSALGR